VHKLATKIFVNFSYLLGLVKELGSELKRQQTRMTRIEAQLGKATGEPVRSPTLRVVDKRGVLEVGCHDNRRSRCLDNHYFARARAHSLTKVSS
jgi:hypothetical protein